MSATYLTSPYKVESFTNLSPFGVDIDDTPELRELISEAEKCQELPFEEKLIAVQNIAIKAMKNAYEGWRSSQDSTCQSIVMEKHSIGFALKEKAGCCRYQAMLFLLLGAAAKLGDKHYLQSTPINGTLNTCYNDIVQDGKVHHVSIFTSSLKDKTYDYSASLGSRVFERPNKCIPGMPFLAYAKDESGAVNKFVREGQHFDV